MEIIKNKKGIVGNCSEVPGLFYSITLLIIGMIIGGIIFGSNSVKLQQENGMLKEGFGDFMMYMVNVTNYCAELNNMTHEELLKSYLRYETDKIVEGFGNS